MTPRARLVAFSLALACAASPAWAAECALEPAVCGRKAFEAGIEAFRGGDFKAAAEHFRAAQGHRAHPVVLFNLALAEAKLGEHLTALEHFERVLADAELPADLRPKVEEEKAAAERRVGTLEVDVVEGMQVFVDGAKVEGSPAIARVNPGSHQVRALEQSRVVLDRSVNVRAGERLHLSVDRTREVVVQSGAPRPDRPDETTSGGPSPVWFYAGAGLTVVLGGITVWSALDTKTAFDDYESDLPSLSQSEADDRVAKGHRLETRTNVLIGATAAAAVGTAVLGLFVVDWSGGKKSSRTGLVLGPGSVTAYGRF